MTEPRVRAVVTGVGAVTPLGVGATALFDGWRDGRSAIVDGVARCGDFEPRDWLDPREIHRTDRCAQLAVAACSEAVEQAGWADGRPPGEAERAACVIGSSVGGVTSLEGAVIEAESHGARYVSPMALTSAMMNAIPSMLAIRHGLNGESVAVAGACASGSQAIGHALWLLEADRADCVVAGGAEACTTRLVLAAFRNAGVLSRSGCCRPFDRDRDGFVMGEGAGVLVLERPAAAAARGAEVLGELLGYGATSDAHHLAAPDPLGHGLGRAVREALDSASVSPESVSYVNANGSATPASDRAEAAALASALGSRAASVPLSTVKSAIGDLMGAAGAVELIATLMSLRARSAPPTIGLAQPEEGLELGFVRGAAQALPDSAPIGLSLSFGFGGHNAALVARAV